MRTTRIIALIAAFCLVASCLACQKPDGKKDTTAPDSTTAAPTTEAPAPSEETTPEAEPMTEEPGEPDGDRAMENFVKKLQAGNYVIEPKKYIKTTAYSPEQVTFTYGERANADNYAFFTYNGETFEGILDTDRLIDVTFASRKNALDTASFILPNSWIALSEGNMFNLFYNNMETPLDFTTNDKNVKKTLLGLAGYPEMAIDLTEEVLMVLDAENPSSVRFTAHVNQPENRMYHFDDLDLTLEFDVGASDPRVEAWLQDPVYPPTKTSWDKMDVATLDQVFNRDYGASTVPFPRFASYALSFDDDAYRLRSEILLSDGHATEQDVESYKEVLLKNGFEAVSETLDGSDVTIYRKLLRSQYNAYADLYPYYEDGFVLRGGMYYDQPEYNGLDAINEVLQANGFAALPETANLGEWNATDISNSRTEGWAFFFDYLLYMPMLIEYQDLDEAKAYFEAYGQALCEQGFSSTYIPGGDREQFETPSGAKLFRYTFNEDNTVTLEFKNEKVLSVEEALQLIRAHGLPEIELHGEIGTRDLTRYQYEISSFTGLFLTVSQLYDSPEEAKEFLDNYVGALEEQGYDYFNPRAVGSSRNFCYFNEDLKKYVAFDYYDMPDGAMVHFEFVSIEPEEDDLLHSVLKH